MKPHLGVMLRSLGRVVGIAVVLACAAAVGVGRMLGPTPEGRRVERARFVNFPIPERPFGEAAPRFVDVATGFQSRLDVPRGDALDLAVVSPWRDDRGQGQVIGRWSSRSGAADGLVLHEFGLGRFTFPEGRPLDRVATEIAPTGRPCWLPGTGAKVLFAAGDGALYRFAFEGSTGSDGSAGGRDSRPRPLSWKVPPPGDGEGHVLASDPTCPLDRGLGDRVVVALSVQARDGDRLRYLPSRLWWLQLDAECGAIEAAGPLTLGMASDSDPVRERCPALARTPSGELVLAYLTRRRVQDAWNLVIAQIDFNAQGDHRPRADPATAVVVAEDCEPSGLAFSPDGTWIYYLPRRGHEGLIRRVAVPRVGPPPTSVAMRGAEGR